MTVDEFKLVNRRRAKILGHTSYFDSPLRVACGTKIINKELIYGKYFITSEFASSELRMLTVRTANIASGMVGILGTQMMHKTIKEAINFIRKKEFK